MTRLVVHALVLAACALTLRALDADTCHLDAQRIESGTRVCYYDCHGRPYVVHVTPSKECPLVLRPSKD